MNLTMTSGRLGDIRHSIHRPATAPKLKRTTEIVTDVVRRGWIAGYQIESFLSAQGLTWMPYGQETCESFGIPLQATFRRPNAKTAECMGGSEARAADFASLLILMERCGFPVDPAPLVNALLPVLRRQVTVTSAELHVLWFAKERHRCEPVTLTAKDRPDVSPPFYPDETVTLPTGYRAEVWFGPAQPSPHAGVIASLLKEWPGADIERDTRAVLRITVTKPKRGHERIAS